MPRGSAIMTFTPNGVTSWISAAVASRDIKPILDASCAKCHGRGKNKGGFRLDTRETFLKGGDSGPVAEAGHSAESLLIALVSGLDLAMGKLVFWVFNGQPKG